MPLPDEPETFSGKHLAVVSVGPDPVVPLTTLGRRDSYAA
jgi:hypothetical protein